MSKVEVIATYSVVDEDGTLEHVCKVDILGLYELEFRKYGEGTTVNIHTPENGLVDVFTSYDLEKSSLRKFRESCVEYAEYLIEAEGLDEEVETE